MKKTSTLFLIIPILLLTLKVTYVWGFPSDIASNKFQPYIENLIQSNIVSGYSDGSFRPNNYLTRGEMAKFVANGFDFEDNHGGQLFPDVTPDNPFFGYINTLRAESIVNGYSDGTYRPDSFVTRAETAKFIYGALNKKINIQYNYSSENSSFSDVGNENIFKGAINYLSNNQIVNGYSDATFRPNNYITRAEMSKMIDKSINIMILGQIDAYLDNNTEVSRMNLSNSVGAYMEVPASITGPGARQINLSTGHTFDCWTFANPISDTIELSSTNCSRTNIADMLTIPNNMDSARDWARNYYGTFTNHIIETNGQKRLVAINHGENKNEIINNSTFANTVNTNILPQDCASQVRNGVYIDCQEAYNGFVTLTWQLFDSAHNYGMSEQIDEGPIVWPANGYTYLGQKSSKGVRHPHGFVENGFLYVFYLDESLGPKEEGRGYGFKVARAKIDDGLTPSSFQTYCNGNWTNSLPSEFSKSTIADFYGRRGGCASNITTYTDNPDLISFAVTKIHNQQNKYLSIEEIFVSGQSKILLRFSTDLVNWSNPIVILERTGYNNLPIHYPLFLDKDARTNESIDPTNFYVYGTDGSGSMNYIHISL